MGLSWISPEKFCGDCQSNTWHDEAASRPGNRKSRSASTGVKARPVKMNFRMPAAIIPAMAGPRKRQPAGGEVKLPGT